MESEKVIVAVVQSLSLAKTELEFGNINNSNSNDNSNDKSEYNWTESERLQREWIKQELNTLDTIVYSMTLIESNRNDNTQHQQQHSFDFSAYQEKVLEVIGSRSKDIYNCIIAQNKLKGIESKCKLNSSLTIQNSTNNIQFNDIQFFNENERLANLTLEIEELEKKYEIEMNKLTVTVEHNLNSKLNLSPRSQISNNNNTNFEINSFPSRIRLNDDIIVQSKVQSLSNPSSNTINLTTSPSKLRKSIPPSLFQPDLFLINPSHPSNPSNSPSNLSLIHSPLSPSSNLQSPQSNSNSKRNKFKHLKLKLIK